MWKKKSSEMICDGMIGDYSIYFQAVINEKLVANDKRHKVTGTFV